jgi:hypothetical protein
MAAEYTKLNLAVERRALEDFQRRIVPDPGKSGQTTRPPRGAKELDLYYDLWTTFIAQDLFIVQAAAKGFDVIDDPELHFLLSRQISDDGDHANHMRVSVESYTGRDPNKDVARLIKEQWDLYGDLPSRDWLGWYGFEFEYELYNVPEIVLSLRSLKVLDPKIEKLGSERIGPDEAFHRDFLAAWWHRRLASSGPQERADILGHMREQDAEYRQRKAAYYESLIRRMSDFGAWSYEQTRPINEEWHSQVVDFLLSVPERQPGTGAA